MNAPLPKPPVTTAPDDLGAVFAAIGEAMETAGTYTSTALQFCEIRDARGLNYAIRCASAALLTAADMLEEFRTPQKPGGRS